MSNWQQQVIEHLPEAVRNDMKKSAILAGLGVVMVGVVLKQFVLTDGMTASAGAAVVAPATPDNANSAPNSSVARQRPRGDSAVVAWLAEPIKTLDRNLFEFKPEFYPRVNEFTQAKVRVIEDELFWEQLAKSLSSRADSKKQKQIRVENLQQAAGKLRVQSTIMGPNPRAMVDGKMTRLGGTVEADAGGGSTVTFKVVRIEARRLVVERDGISLELPMGTGRARVLGEEE